MKKKKLLALIGSVCLIVVLAALPFMAACAAPTPPPVTPPPTTPPVTPPPKVEWPETVSAICPAPAGVMYATLVGMGPVIEKYTPIKHWVVETLGGPTIWAPLMKESKADFANHNQADILMNAFLGRGAFAEPDMGPMPVRSVCGGHTYAFAWHTIPGTGIKSIADLKGKLVYGRMKGNPMFYDMAEAQLASVGLSVDDLKGILTLASIDEGARDLIEGRVDAILYPITPSAVMQINEAKGECIFLNLTKEQADFVAERMPGYYPSVIEAGDPRFANKSEIRYAICYRCGLHVRADMPDEVVYGVTKAILEHIDEWKDCHPQAKYYGPQYHPAHTAAEPYHPGAIKYFKEVGLWSDELQAHQEKYLKLQEELLKKWGR